MEGAITLEEARRREAKAGRDPGPGPMTDAPPPASEADYGAAEPGIQPEDFDQYDGQMIEPEAKPNVDAAELGEQDAGDDDAPILRG